MLEVRAFAKINVHLSVHGRRPDGFHELTTVFQTVGLADTLSLAPADGPLALRCPGSDLPEDASNLVMRAATALAEELGRPLPEGFRFTLHKQIPTQAGLGGGSADAVAAMRALAALWGEEAAPDLLARVGRRLGSDVPFFAFGGTALGQGRGDQVTRLPDLPPMAVVIARPSFGVPTADAYRWLAASRSDAGKGAEASAGGPADLAWPSTADGWPGRLAACHNDFEPVVCARHPEIAAGIRLLREAGARLACLSGSGSAIVGLFADEVAAEAAAAPFAARPGWRCWLTQTVDAAAYARDAAPRRI
ncbi:MAG TPA: 4-(cytidine 5'-diphospho)-2-C-methyl-D-erythritol kinase [Vicinamibacterales bacterium]